jgi:hypothetical protein
MTQSKWKKSVETIALSFFTLGLTAPVFIPMTVQASSVDRIVDTTSDGVATSADSSKSIQVDENGNQYYSPSGEFSNVNAKDANNWAKRKGGDLVGFFTTLAEPLAVVIFIISAIMLAVGALAKGDWFKRGLFGMAISIVMWTAVVFAPELIQFFSEWLST